MSNDVDSAAALEELGLSEGEAKLYECLLRTGGGSAKELARAASMTTKRVAQLLDALEASGVANRAVRGEERFVPVPPDDVVGALTSRREQELQQSARSAMRFLERVAEPAGWPKREFLQVIVGAETAAERLERMLLGAEKEVLGFTTGPITGTRDEWVKAKVDLLRGGVRGRVVYDLESLQVPGITDFIDAVSFAEEARTVTALPLPLAIVDRRVAFLPLTADAPNPDTEIFVVYESAFLDLLIMMFEAVWERAAPFGAKPHEAVPPAGPELSEDERNLVALMGAGMKETAIARQYGVSIRTVERRLTAIADRLGTNTRFHTAVEACRRGWISV